MSVRLDLVLLAGVGAGKGTQARRLAAERGLLHLATGDLLRRHVEMGTALGQQAGAFMATGDLVPDDLVIGMLVARLGEHDAEAGVVLDGFPRTLAQAAALDAALAGLGRCVNRALYLRVVEEILVARTAGRWTCRVCGATYRPPEHPPATLGQCDLDGGELYQREDDRPEVVAERLLVYLRQTMPVVGHYERAGVLREIDASEPIEVVAAAIAAAVDSR